MAGPRMINEPTNRPLNRRPPEYHARHAARVAQILQDLNQAGKTLKRSDVKLCENYAIDVFRHKAFTPWLLAYTAVSGNFKEGWIPDNFYGEKVVPEIQGPYGRMSLLKSMSPAVLNSPSFPDLAMQINGTLFDRAYEHLSFDEARKRLFEHADHIVFKADGSGQGKSIHFLDQDSFNRETVARLGSGVFQRRIQQHAFFQAFSGAAVAAVRITTVVEPTGKISPRAAYMCLPIGSDTHVQGSSRIRMPVDLSNGALAEIALDARWLECLAHPTSGETFAGKKIPAFKACVRTVIAHHQRIAFVGSVGWDVVVDSDGEVQILEWNGFHNGIGFSEATQGPCFADLGWERFA